MKTFCPWSTHRQRTCAGGWVQDRVTSHVPPKVSIAQRLSTRTGAPAAKAAMSSTASPKNTWYVSSVT
jgi:hypothetical protein